MDIAVLDACPGFKEDVLYAAQDRDESVEVVRASISNVTQSAMIAAAFIRLRRHSHQVAVRRIQCCTSTVINLT